MFEIWRIKRGKKTRKIRIGRKRDHYSLIWLKQHEILRNAGSIKLQPAFLDHHDLPFGYDCGQVHKLIWCVRVFLPSNGPVLEKILRLLTFEQQEGEMAEVTNWDNLKVRGIISNWGLDYTILHFTALDWWLHFRMEAVVSGRKWMCHDFQILNQSNKIIEVTVVTVL